MQRITLTVKDDNKINFLLELLRQFEFIEIQKSDKKGNMKKQSFHDLLGVLSEEEATEMEKEIDASCEQIHEDDWK